ncbi:MFS transporter [Pontibacter sp. E15-1]|uniref:MFS transporter n=1 Tax=Pontibacter sp. E15-1 TaxID=2919918 RepID=UPI001F4FE605|nr:MFS transporter [Pontibacter sp. E15-1]MCJ8165079.1 MFS transporter [Pontibacter sp. E15-1]
MRRRINQLLNIKPSEEKLVSHLFLVQYFLGVGTAFLFTSSLTLILSSYPVTVFPRVYILAAGFLFVANLLYSRLEKRLASDKLLYVVVAFSAVSLLVHWVTLTFFSSEGLPLLLAVWNMVVYMLVGYAFWGMAAILFNVRESKRLFSIVGAGDIPAKMLGYFSVTALVPFIGVVNLLWVSILSFVVVLVLLRRFNYKDRMIALHHMASHAPDKASRQPVVKRYFHNRLILYIAFWSLLAYTIYAFIDFTFLSEIKRRYTTDHELATFIAVFFAFGRLLALGFKVLFSSRVIARLGLANCLLIAPALMLTVVGFILLSDGTLEMHLYAFGVMVLLSEILRSTLQEPVFFVLFQPLHPHSRLKGHLIAKGYTLPFALFFVGVFLIVYLQYFGHEHLAIPLVSQLLFFMILGWGASVFLVRRAYRRTLESVIRRGYFTGSELFLHQQSVKEVLVEKVKSKDPKVAIHALHLLEQSGYAELPALLLRQLQHGARELREYAVLRILELNLKSALPSLREQLLQETDEMVQALLTKAVYQFEPVGLAEDTAAMHTLSKENKKAALTGLLSRRENAADAVVARELLRMAHGSDTADKLAAIEIVADTQRGDYEKVLETLLHDETPAVYKKALEGVGKVRDLHLLEQAVQVGLGRKAAATLQKALLLYGDPVFAAPQIRQGALSKALVSVLIKVASKTSGNYSTGFLERLVQENHEDLPEILDALWQKKTGVSGATQRLLKKRILHLLRQSQLKASYYLQLVAHDTVKPLQEAVCSEIRQDIQTLCKGLALVYDRKRIERVMELYTQGNDAKVYNAIEMLELVIPQKYFTGLNMLMELEQDIGKGQVYRYQQREMSAGEIIEEILVQNKAGFRGWTKSVACYMIPRLQSGGFPVQALAPAAGPEDPLFQETREYVLATLNE